VSKVTLTATDEELMRAYINGDYFAFKTLYKRYSAKVYGYLFKKLQNREVTNEIFQNVFLKFHQARTNYDFNYLFTQWIFVIAKTTLLDHFRKVGREIKTIDEEINFDLLSQKDPTPTLSEDKELEMLNSLSQEQRQVIQMRVIDERSYEDIASALGRSQISVRQMVSRGLKHLRTLGGKS